MNIRWHEIDHRLRGVDGLDDVLSIDLNFLCRQMQPPVERQYRHGPSETSAYGYVLCAIAAHKHMCICASASRHPSTTDIDTVSMLKAMDVG